MKPQHTQTRHLINVYMNIHLNHVESSCEMDIAPVARESSLPDAPPLLCARLLLHVRVYTCMHTHKHKNLSRSDDFLQ